MLTYPNPQSVEVQYLKLCRNPAYKGYKDSQDGRMENEKTIGNAEAPKLEKVFVIVGIKLFQGRKCIH